jgi:DNA-binding MarR family transcriptional regulator
MVLSNSVREVMTLYPRILFACRTRQVRDEKGGGVTLSAHQASLLDHLDEVEPTGTANLARYMGVKASTISLTIDRLVRNGFVLRETDARDGRRVNVRLTEEGMRVRDQKTVLDPKLVAAMLRRLRVPERDEAIRGLALLAKAAAELIQTGEFKRLTRMGATLRASRCISRADAITWLRTGLAS